MSPTPYAADLVVPIAWSLVGLLLAVLAYALLRGHRRSTAPTAAVPEVDATADAAIDRAPDPAVDPAGPTAGPTVAAGRGVPRPRAPTRRARRPRRRRAGAVGVRPGGAAWALAGHEGDLATAVAAVDGDDPVVVLRGCREAALALVAVAGPVRTLLAPLDHLVDAAATDPATRVRTAGFPAELVELAPEADRPALSALVAGQQA